MIVFVNCCCRKIDSCRCEGRTCGEAHLALHRRPYILVVLLDVPVSLYMFVNVPDVALVMSSRILVVMDEIFFLEMVMDEITWKFVNWAKLWAW